MKHTPFRLHFLGELSIVAFLAYLLLSPTATISAAKQGLELWAGAVLPTLLPFSVAVLLLREADTLSHLPALCRAIGWAFGLPAQVGGDLLLAWCSGYPVGARLTGDRLRAGELSPASAQHMLALTSTANPLFLIGTVGTVFFGNPVYGALIALGHYAAAILPALLGGYLSRRKARVKTLAHPGSAAPLKDGAYRAAHRQPPLTAALGTALREASLLQLPIAATIALANVLLSALPMPIENWAAVRGFVEMSSGCATVAAGNGGLYARLALCAAIVSFGGLAIHAQTIAVLGETELSLRAFWLRKMRHALLAAAITAISAPIFLRGAQPALSAVSPRLLVTQIPAVFLAGSLLLAVLARKLSARS